MQNLGISKPPCTVIHNGADHQQFHQLTEAEIEEFRQQKGADAQFVLLTVGNVSDRKGQEVVIRALPEMTASTPNVVYWMAGLPQEQAKLESIALDLGVSDHIRFWGRMSTETLLQLYNACDLFLMTSRQCEDGDFEGYGIAVIEAALCGKTAVVSDNSGLAEAVQDGVTGLLVPQNDPDQTAQAILRLIKDPELRQKLEIQATENALTHQTWEKVGARYVEVFEEILKRVNQGKP
jgi:phosphatidylinositol alpha-1,6-mannosyltransferase